MIAARARRLRGVYYGWWMLAGSVVAMALGSGVSFWAFGLYIEPFETQFGWSRGEVSGAFSVALLTGALSGPLVGRWIDERGPRQVILAGVVLTALSYLLLATTSEMWQWYAWSAINGVFRQMMFFIPFQALISRWFDRRRGLALSVLGAGFALGGVVVVPVMRAVIDAVGWAGSFVVSSVAVTAIFLPIGLLLVRNDPSDVGQHPDGVEPVGTATPSRLGGLALGAAMRTPHFWLVSFGLMFYFFGMFGMLVHQVPLYESIGLSRGGAAGVVSLMAACNIPSRLIYGTIADRVTRFELVGIGMCVSLALAMVVLLLDLGLAGIAVFIPLWVIGTGGIPIVETILLTRMFGLAHFGTIFGAVLVIEEVGIVASPTIAGWIFDATGRYDFALVLFAATFVGSASLFALVVRLPRLRHEPARAA